MDPLRIFADPFNHCGNFYGTPSYTHVLDDLFSVPRAGDAFSPLSPWDAEPEVIPIPATRSRRKDRTRSKPKRKAAEAPHSPTRSIPIRVDGPDAKPKREAAEAQQQRTEPVAVAGRRALLSAEAAAVRVQAAARGFLARRAVQAVRTVEKEAEDVGRILRQREEELRGDKGVRVAAGEELMRMLLRLDAVRGAREYRRKVTRRVLALQDFVDAHEPKAMSLGDEIAEEESAVKPRDAVDGVEIEVAAQVMATEPGVVVEETEDAATEVNVVEIDEEAEQDDGIQVKAAVETEVDGGSADGETDAAETKPASEKPDGSDAEWEIVPEEPSAAPAAAACLDDDEPRQEPAGQVVTSAADASAGIVDMGKMMEMVATLCERNAQQYALIGALVERVDVLERTVRRMEEDAERQAIK